MTAELSGTQLAALRTRLEEALGHPLPAPLRVGLLSGGRSNLTYRLTSGTHEWVLRRPPLGHVLESAHDMSREYRVISALQGTTVPVPGSVLYHRDPDLLGADFYVMELIDGRVLRTEQDLTALPVPDRRALAEGLIDTLAALHAVDYRQVGLATLGRPAGYLQRQLDRWQRQLAASRSRTVPGLAELGARLAEHVPPSPRAALVHGDYRLDNVILAPAEAGRILAVLDWEMATIGDPLTDLGLFYLYWEGWAGLDNPIAATPGEIDGYPSFAELADRYRRAGGADLDHFAWYQGFAVYKFAVICEGIHYRHVNGLTVGAGFDTIGAMVPELARRGLRIIGS